MKHSLLILGLVTTCVFVSCKKDDNPDDFDRKAMLTNMVSAVIKPSLNEVAADLANLHIAAQTFSSSSDVSNLNSLKTGFLETYRSFQHCKMFDFGPMMTYALKAGMNTYPTDTAQIQANISSGSYVLSAVDNVDAIGLPALDFLLYYQGESAVINSFTIDANAANRKTYLTDLTSKMKSEFDLVVSGWTSYEADFINADGNDAGSSTSLLFNEWVKDIELLNNAKIGVPAGQQTGGMTLPEYVEGYYSQISIELAKENVTGLKNVFNGAAGSGFDDYIIDVQGEDGTLASDINAQFDLVTSTLNAIGTPLSEKVDTDPTAVNNAWLEIKKLITFTKTDMSSTLGLLITFQDNDGD